MKHIITLCLIIFLLLSLAGCVGEKAPAMWIAPAKLTEEETAVSKLLGAGDGHTIFDYHVVDSDITVSINTYRLVDGAWDMIAGGGGLRFAGSGRIALSFDKITDGLRIAVQEGDQFSATSFTPQKQEFKDISGYATSVLTDQKAIAYEEEIPLVIQILTNKNQIRSFDPSYFYNPTDYETYGYEGVFAITVTFSQEPLT